MTMPNADTANDANAVADAAPNDWTGRLPPSVRPYAQLARWDRPIGWWLLLWPCWWSAALALNAGLTSYVDIGPQVQALFEVKEIDPGERIGSLWSSTGVLLALFWVGAVAMRGAGCTGNDITDRHLDAGVARTRSRPIPSGRVGVGGAVTFLLAQLLAGLGVLLALAFLSPEPGRMLALGFLAVPVIVAYPFAKRVTDWPQAVLGLAFAWGALLGPTILYGAWPGWPVLLLYMGTIAWVIGYDTIYAHQDREDDALVGVRSTARLFGERTKTALVILYGLALVLFTAAFAAAGVHVIAYAGLALAGLHMGRQIVRLDIDDGEQCLRLFQSNKQVGWLVFGGLIAAAALRLP